MKILRGLMMNKLFTLPKLWAILEEELGTVQQAYMKYLAGDEIGAFNVVRPHANVPVTGLLDDLLNFNMDKVPPTSFMNGDIGVLPVEGVIMPKTTFWTRFMGAATLDVMTRDFTALVNDDSVKAIVLDIDSPGGVAFGVEQFANIVYEAREVKPIYSITSTMMASAAMWIGAAAEEVFITGEVVMTGSIGTVISHIDISELEKMLGVKTTEISAGKFKRIASNFKPLSEEGRAELQSQVNHVNDAFVSAIAKFRGVEVEIVVSDMADGKTLIGSKGIEAGLIDGILSAEDLVKRINAETNGSADNSKNFIGGKGMGAIVAKDKGVIAGISAKDLEECNAKVYEEVLAIGAESVSGKIEAAKTAGIEEGKKLGVEEGKAIGVKSERERILAVEAAGLPGHEKLIAKLKADGTTTGPEAAAEVVKAENAKLSSGLNTLKAEAGKPVENSAEETETTSAGKTPKEKWDADSKLRAEYGDDFAAFEAYEKALAEGRVRVLGRN